MSHNQTMKLSEFSTLPRAEQMNKLRTEGVYIGKRICGNQRVLLYQVDSFYIEVYYTRYRIETEHVKISDDVTILDPYLKQVEVGFLSRGKF